MSRWELVDKIALYLGNEWTVDVAAPQDVGLLVGKVSGPHGLRLRFMARTKILEPKIGHICPPLGWLRVEGQFPITKSGLEAKLGVEISGELAPPEMALEIKARLLPAYADFLSALKKHSPELEEFQEIDQFRPPLPEGEAASTFVRCMIDESRFAWPSIYASLRETFGRHFLVGDETLARFHCALGAISLGLQAAKNFYPADQTRRIELWVFSELKEVWAIDELKRYSAAYQQASLNALHPLEPTSAVTSHLLHYWLGENIRKFEAEIEGRKTGLINPLLVSAVMSTLSAIVAKWSWKTVWGRMTLVNT